MDTSPVAVLDIVSEPIMKGHVLQIRGLLKTKAKANIYTIKSATREWLGVVEHAAALLANRLIGTYDFRRIWDSDLMFRLAEELEEREREGIQR